MTVLLEVTVVVLVLTVVDTLVSVVVTGRKRERKRREIIISGHSCDSRATLTNTKVLFLPRKYKVRHC